MRDYRLYPQGRERRFALPDPVSEFQLPISAIRVTWRSRWRILPWDKVLHVQMANSNVNLWCERWGDDFIRMRLAIRRMSNNGVEWVDVKYFLHHEHNRDKAIGHAHFIGKK
ncbi:hypothetical protein [Aeromonas eucrenophila]|uniref:Uncharacterized protein n=1 Tax=Aeromonas eucrenophila TaxID=649 RepID=A0ABW0YK23_9GAMM|nr:hypothetical protein [Aeromonas eucrenophila]